MNGGDSTRVPGTALSGSASTLASTLLGKGIVRRTVVGVRPKTAAKQSIELLKGYEIVYLMYVAAQVGGLRMDR